MTTSSPLGQEVFVISDDNDSDYKAKRTYQGVKSVSTKSKRASTSGVKKSRKPARKQTARSGQHHKSQMEPHLSPIRDSPQPLTKLQIPMVSANAQPVILDEPKVTFKEIIKFSESADSEEQTQKDATTSLTKLPKTGRDGSTNNDDALSLTEENESFSETVQTPVRSFVGSFIAHKSCVSPPLVGDSLAYSSTETTKSSETQIVKITLDFAGSTDQPATKRALSVDLCMGANKRARSE